MIAAVEKLTESLRGKVMLMVGRAILTAVGDGGGVQRVQAALLADESHDDAERIQEYGFSSVPLSGAEAVMVFPAGCRDHGLVVATDDRRYRKKGLQPGEVCLYTDEGDSMIFQRGKILHIEVGSEVRIVAPLVTVRASTKARFETPLLEVTGDIKDRCDAAGRTMSGMRGIYNTHTHPENDSGGPTSAPNQGM